VLCSECSLIAHSKCASHAPPTCDLPAQLPYAQQAEKSDSSSMYVNPRDTRTDSQVSNFPLGPISEVPYARHRARLSYGLPPPQHSLVRPPTASKFLSRFRPENKSSTSSGTRSGTSSAGSSSAGSSSGGTSSLWSAGTGTDDSSTRHHGMQSAMFDVDTRASDRLLSTMDNVDALKRSSVVSASRAHDVNRIEGRLLGRAQKRRDRDTNGCNVQ
jgi:hypothetical protein